VVKPGGLDVRDLRNKGTPNDQLQAGLSYWDRRHGQAGRNNEGEKALVIGAD